MRVRLTPLDDDGQEIGLAADGRVISGNFDGATTCSLFGPQPGRFRAHWVRVGDDGKSQVSSATSEITIPEHDEAIVIDIDLPEGL